MSEGRYTPCRLATCRKPARDDGYCSPAHHATCLRVLAARVIRQASSDGVASPSSGATPTSAVTAFSKDAPQARGDGISSTGSVPGSPVVAGPVDISGSGSTRIPSPDERPSVAPLPHP